MRYEIVLSPGALGNLHALRAYDRQKVQDGIEEFLRYKPLKVSISRIKRLVGVSHPQFRLRIDSIRIFYDADPDAGEVKVLAIVQKNEAARWLAEHGIIK